MGTTGAGEVPSVQGKRSLVGAKALPCPYRSPWAVAGTVALVWDVGSILHLSHALLYIAPELSPRSSG